MRAMLGVKVHEALTPQPPARRRPRRRPTLAALWSAVAAAAVAVLLGAHPA